MPATSLEQKRSHIIKVSVTPAIWAKLTAISEVLGIPPSAIAALAVSEYAATKHLAFTSVERNMNAAIEAMMPHLLPVLDALSKEGKKGEIIDSDTV
jgi:hypothetical protein